MDLYLNQTLLPAYRRFKEVATDNVAKNYTLDSTLKVDLVNHRRAWVIGWDLMTAADYATVRGFYDRQFSLPSGSLTQFWCAALNLNVYVYITVNERNMRWQNRMVEGFEIVLEEQYAVS